MPVRSLNSSVLKWPDAATVDAAARKWARDLTQEHPGILRIAYFGSYAQGDWGVGSDLDLIVIMEKVDEPKEKRGLKWDTSSIPVPVDMQIFTQTEWTAIPHDSRFKKAVDLEAVWIYSKS